MIAYRGDHSLAQKFPHGNATIKTNFIPSVPSVKIHVRNICRKIPSVETLFINTKADQTAEQSVVQTQVLVREPKQIANYRAREKQSFIVSQCQLTSFHILSMYHLKDFIRFSNTIHEFHCVMADPEAIKLANILLKVSENDPSLDQVINYDTTFDMGEFYLSSFVMKNTLIKQDRIFPVAFFVHNRKDTLTHKAFFDWIFNQLDFPAVVPFVTDREHSIVNNILGHAVGVRQLFYCTIHIARDVKHWCRSKRYVKAEIDRCWIRSKFDWKKIC